MILFFKLLFYQKLYRLRRKFENSKILGETARFAEMLENLNKFSKLIHHVKSPSSMPIETPMVSCDILTNLNIPHGSQLHPVPPSLPVQTSSSAVLEDLSEYFDVTALLPHSSPHQETFITINDQQC